MLHLRDDDDGMFCFYFSFLSSSSSSSYYYYSYSSSSSSHLLLHLLTFLFSFCRFDSLHGSWHDGLLVFSFCFDLY